MNKNGGLFDFFKRFVARTRDDDFEESPVASSNIKTVAYDPKNKKLRIKFHNGGHYEYDNVGDRLFQKLMNADSKGKYFHRALKKNQSQYPYLKLAWKQFKLPVLTPTSWRNKGNT